MDAIRVLARQPNDPNAQLLAERRINEYLRRDVEKLEASLKQVRQAISPEANKRVEGENWSLIGEYVQSCREKLRGLFGT